MLKQQWISALESKHRTELEKEIGHDCFHGCVLSIPFTDSLEHGIENLVSKSRLTETQQTDAKLAIAALIEPSYITFACRIWLYIAVINEHRCDIRTHQKQTYEIKDL